jgi:hypothetical protein
MLSVKAVMLAMLLPFALNGAGSCDAKKNGNVPGSNQPVNSSAPVNRLPEKNNEKAVTGELKMLAQGQQSRLRNAFIAVARDAQTYEELRKTIPGLPAVGQDFFKSNLVVAAFLGERRTGGYGVRFRRAGDGALGIEETTPPKDAMVVQVITTPFAVAAVPVENQEPLALEPGNAWRAMTRPYRVRVAEGEFIMAGGIAGRSEKFRIDGSILVMREGNLATLFFDLHSGEGAKPRVLKDAASGLVQGDGRVAINHLSAGSFVDPPADQLRATGSFAENENRLSLTFESIPGSIRDGFNGTGNLKAEAVAPAPPKNKASTEDTPQ